MPDRYYYEIEYTINYDHQKGRGHILFAGDFMNSSTQIKSKLTELVKRPSQQITITKLFFLTPAEYQAKGGPEEGFKGSEIND